METKEYHDEEVLNFGEKEIPTTKTETKPESWPDIKYENRIGCGFDHLSEARVLAPKVTVNSQHATILFEKKNNYTKPIHVVPLICVFYMPSSLCDNGFRLKLLRFLMKLCGFKFGEIKER